MAGNSIAYIAGSQGTAINTNNSDIPQWSRVDVAGGLVSGQVPVSLAGNTKPGIGIVQQDLPATEFGVASTVGAMRFTNAQGTQILLASNAIAAGAEFDLGANGQYVTTVGSPVGRALTVAATGGSAPFVGYLY